MNEITEGTQIPRETLTLESQVPMLIPKEIKNLRLAGQLPQGDVAYIDLEDFNTVRLVDQKTWKPVAKKGIETRFNLDKIVGRSFPAIIFVTPPRTKDYPLDNEIQKLSGLLRRSSKREEGFIKEQYLGTLFVVEARSGVDEKKNWREKQMRENGLVVDKKRGESAVVITDDFIISQGRRPMQKRPVDLTKGPRSRYTIPDFIEKIERDAARLGLEADTTELMADVKASSNPRRTMDNLRNGTGGVTYRIPGTNDTFTRNIFGEETVVPNKDAFPKPEEEKEEPSINDNRKDNFKFVGKHETNHVCPVNNSHKLVAHDYQKEGKRVWFNKRQESCSTHGYIRTVDMGYQHQKAPIWQEEKST